MALFLYAFIDAGGSRSIRPDLGPPPDECGPPEVLPIDGSLAAVVSRCESESILPSRRNLLAYREVVGNLLSDARSVVPARFGMLLPDKATLRREVVGDDSGQLRALLNELAGTYEYNIKAVYDEDAVLAEIVTTDPEAKRLRSRTIGIREDASYYDRIQLGEVIVDRLQRKRSRDAEGIVSALAPLSIRNTVHELLTETMVVNASFLVSDDGQEAFLSRARSVEASVKPLIEIRCTEPLPPFSFSELNLTAAPGSRRWD